jgi:hypothetical protein
VSLTITQQLAETGTEPERPARRLGTFMRRLGALTSQLIWMGVLVTALFSALEFNLSSPESAPQQGALGAITVARVVIAYVFARSFDALIRVRR